MSVSHLIGLRLSRYCPILLLPAGLGLCWQIGGAATVAERLLLLALVLFCLELTYMAYVDLNNLYGVRERSLSEKALPIEQDISLEATAIDSQLTRFYRVVISTIVLEAVGFYMALFSLSTGAAVIIFSQLWFNLLAGIALFPDETPAVVPYALTDRAAVLIADSVGLVLLLCWPIESLRIWLSAGLFILITLFLLIKYGAVDKSLKLLK